MRRRAWRPSLPPERIQAEMSRIAFGDGRPVESSPVVARDAVILRGFGYDEEDHLHGHLLELKIWWVRV